jgi:hypothetical protein
MLAGWKIFVRVVLFKSKPFGQKAQTILYCLAEKNALRPTEEKLRELQTSSTVISFW